MSTEPGNYYFIVAPHASANAGAGEHHAMAVTAGLKVGDHITVEPHDSQYLERQRWKITPAEDNSFHIESLLLPNHWLGFAKMIEGEPLVLCTEPRSIWIFYHPPPSGQGHWMLMIRHENPNPKVVVEQPEPGKILTLGFYNDEGIIKGMHFDPERVASDE